jgi:hypothetical protein
MPRWEQYEVWAMNGEKWELVASFMEFDVANAVSKNRSGGGGVRLIHAVYEGNTLVKQDVIAEVGKTRQEP